MSELRRVWWGCAVSAAAFFCQRIAAQEAVQSVVGHYHFDEGKGGWAFDASAAENGGMLGRMPTEDGADLRWAANGREGGALDFDGSSDVVTIPHSDSLNFVSGIVVEAWIYQRSRTPFARVLDKGPCFDVYIHANGMASFRFHGAEAHGIRGRKPVPLNQWVHLKAAYDGKTMTLFIDGEKVGSRPYNKPIPNRPNDLRIGSAQFGRFFHGMIDEVKIVNIGYSIPAATPYESDANTVGLWHFDAAGRAVDAGPNGLHGEIHGAKLVNGKIGKALEFDGDDYVRIPYHTALDLRDELTIDCWVKQMALSPYARVVEKDNWIYGLWIEQRGNADFFYTPSPKGYSHTVSLQGLPLYRWVRVRVEFDGLESVMYFDGEEVARNDVPPDKAKIATSEGDLFIGNRKGEDRGFVGLIDELRISRTVRTKRPPIAFRVAPLPSDNVWNMAFVARPLRRQAGSVRWGLRHLKRGKTYKGGDISDHRGGFATTTVDVADLPSGDYVLWAAAIDRNGAELARGETKMTKPETPAWLGSKTGITDEVLPPWTPIKVRSQTSEVRGQTDIARVVLREYEVGSSGLPVQIVSRGKELLAEPISLTLAGERLEWSKKLIDQKPAKASWESKADTSGLALTMTTTLEFDGMMRFDLDLEAERPLEVARAYVDIPLIRQHAALMHHPLGNWFKDPTCAGAVPSEGWQRPHTWYVWVGNEDRGLCWFAEDQPAWGLDPKKPGIELIPEGNVVRLRFHLINAGAKLAGPRRYTWGLMATPVKPMPKGWQRWRFGSPNGPVTVGVRWSTLHTSKWHSFPVPPNPEWYHAQVTKAHQEGRKFVPYTNFNMQSDTGPDWEYWGEEWNGYAGKGLAADVLAMNVENIRCCAMTPSWCDFIAHKYKHFLEEYDSDGFYLDNSMPATCRNPAHPSDHHNRRHIFAARELMKRFYTVTKQNDPANVMVCHMSSRLCIPVLSFCDAIVDGEQYGWSLKEAFDAHYIPITPPDRVRAELMGRQWGLIPLFLPCNRGPNRWNAALMRELLALMLPHGVRFWLSGHRPTMLKVLDVVDGFGIDEAKFVPYWREPNWRRLADERKILVTAYVRKRGLMIIASNLSDERQELTLRLDSPALGAAGPRWEVADPLDDLPASLRENTLSFTIGPRDMRILALTFTRQRAKSRLAVRR